MHGRRRCVRGVANIQACVVRDDGPCVHAPKGGRRWVEGGGEGGGARKGGERGGQRANKECEVGR